MKTKTIKQMYDELNAEVIRKIKAGDFTVTKTEKHVVTIEVEGLTFSFWIANGWEFLESNGSFDHENAVTLTMTREDKKAIFDLIGLSDEDRVRMEIEELQKKIDLMKIDILSRLKTGRFLCANVRCCPSSLILTPQFGDAPPKYIISC